MPAEVVDLIGGNEEMSLDARKSRNWRKGRKKGVSPIIATILLVAITVVLAAVLYVLITGLTKGPGNTPIGTAFGMASPQSETGAAGVAACTTVGEACYTIQVASAGGGIGWNSVTFVVHDQNGNPVSLSGGKVTVINQAKAVVANCTLGSPCAVVATMPSGISTSDIIVLDTGSTTSGIVSGDSFIADGSGSYSSSTQITLP